MFPQHEAHATQGPSNATWVSHQQQQPNPNSQPTPDRKPPSDTEEPWSTTDATWTQPQTQPPPTATKRDLPNNRGFRCWHATWDATRSRASEEGGRRDTENPRRLQFPVKKKKKQRRKHESQQTERGVTHFATSVGGISNGRENGREYVIVNVRCIYIYILLLHTPITYQVRLAHPLKK